MAHHEIYTSTLVASTDLRDNAGAGRGGCLRRSDAQPDSGAAFADAATTASAADSHPTPTAASADGNSGTATSGAHSYARSRCGDPAGTHRQGTAAPGLG